MTPTDLHLAYKRSSTKYPPNSLGYKYMPTREAVRDNKAYAEWLEGKLIALMSMIDGTSTNKNPYEELTDLLGHGN